MLRYVPLYDLDWGIAAELKNHRTWKSMLKKINLDIYGNDTNLLRNVY